MSVRPGSRAPRSVGRSGVFTDGSARALRMAAHEVGVSCAPGRARRTNRRVGLLSLPGSRPSACDENCPAACARDQGDGRPVFVPDGRGADDRGQSAAFAGLTHSRPTMSDESVWIRKPVGGSVAAYGGVRIIQPQVGDMAQYVPLAILRDGQAEVRSGAPRTQWRTAAWCTVRPARRGSGTGRARAALHALTCCRRWPSSPSSKSSWLNSVMSFAAGVGVPHRPVQLLQLGAGQVMHPVFRVFIQLRPVPGLCVPV